MSILVVCHRLWLRSRASNATIFLRSAISRLSVSLKQDPVNYTLIVEPGLSISVLVFCFTVLSSF